MTDFTKQVLDIIQSIPKGNVMTYGQIAAVAGNPRGARQVSRILSGMSGKHHLPWHRVINSKGGISLTGEAGFIQAEMLRSEGVEVIDQRVNLKKYQYHFN